MGITDKQSKKHVILGGGPSGLGVAWGLVEKGHSDILILELKDKLGGLSASFTMHGLTLDYGPHRFSPQIFEVLEKIKKLLGQDLMKAPNIHAVYFEHQLYCYPPRLIDFLNINSLLLTAEFGISWMWARLKNSCRNLFTVNDNHQDFEGILISNFGWKFVHKVAKPMIRKVWGDVDLASEFTTVRFSLPSVTRIIKKILNPESDFNHSVFYYPRQGFQKIWDEIGNYLVSRGVEIHTNSIIERVEISGRRVKRITYSCNGKQEQADVDWLISTIPSMALLDVLNPNPFEELGLLHEDFSCRALILVISVLKKPDVLPARVMIFPEGNIVFNRLSEQNKFSRELVPDNHAAVTADIITNLDSDLYKKSDAEIQQIVVDQIIKIGFFRREDLKEVFTVRVPEAYPIPTISRREAQKKLDKGVKRIENLILTGRFASSDYNNSHNALAKGFLAAKVINQEKTIDDWERDGAPLGNLPIQD